MKPTLADRSIIQAQWLIKVRWIIAFGAIGSIGVVYLLEIVALNFFWLFFVSTSLFVLNVLYLLDVKRIEHKDEMKQEKPAKRNIHFQIALDFLVLTVLIHFSGGIENPCIIFFVFHMIIGSILLPARGAFLQALLGISLFSTLTILEYLEILNHYTLNESISSLIFSDPGYLFFALSVFAFTSLALVYITVTLAERIRQTKSELKRSNEHLTEKDKIKNEYVYRVTHDIKSDLTTIASCLTVVNKQLLAPLDSQNANFITKAFQRTQKLNQFVDDLLSLTHMRLNNRYDVKEFNLSEVATNVYNQLRPLAVEKHLEYTLELPANPVFMEGMRISIEEAMLNLLSNAIKYTPASGEVKLSLQSGEGQVMIHVIDSGYGIPNEEQEFVFDEFFRAKNVKEHEGTGVGLALVKAIVNRHKGHIRMKSELNQGSQFTMIFSLQKPDH
jgi:signal transduction histidine kinase